MTPDGKVLFIVHDLYQEDNHFPSGIGYLAAVLKQKGCEVTIFSQDVFHYTNDILAQYLTANTFDLICIGFLAARYIETVRPLCEVINCHKKNAWLVLGGHGPSPIPEYILKDTKADIIAIGESEDTICELLRCKLDNGDLSRVKGIAYRTNSDILVNERRKPIRDLDLLPFPEWSLFPMDKYTTSLKLFGMTDQERTLGIITSRGCINRCNFCYRLEKGIRFRSIPNVIEEIIHLKERYGVIYFIMMDELFVYPKKRIFEFCEQLEKHDLKIKFSCNARVDIFDKELALCLKDCGCKFLNFGMESSEQKVLDLMNKHTSVEQNIRAAEIAREVGIGLGLNFIWGNLGDSEESLKNNVKLIKKYNTYDQLRTIRPVTPYPGCDLYYDAIRRGVLKGPDDFFKRFKNSDLMLVNFMDIPENKVYQVLYNANKELILDYYQHTSGELMDAENLINNFYQLYFYGKSTFRGARHYKKIVEVPVNSSIKDKNNE
jgi:radical SAM superfamily enzyme YgiQ (UPF0313 family)